MITEERDRKKGNGLPGSRGAYHRHRRCESFCHLGRLGRVAALGNAIAVISGDSGKVVNRCTGREVGCRFDRRVNVVV